VLAQAGLTAALAVAGSTSTWLAPALAVAAVLVAVVLLGLLRNAAVSFPGTAEAANSADEGPTLLEHEAKHLDQPLDQTVQLPVQLTEPPAPPLAVAAVVPSQPVAAPPFAPPAPVEALLAEPTVVAAVPPPPPVMAPPAPPAPLVGVPAGPRTAPAALTILPGMQVAY